MNSRLSALATCLSGPPSRLHPRIGHSSGLKPALAIVLTVPFELSLDHRIHGRSFATSNAVDSSADRPPGPQTTPRVLTGADRVRREKLLRIVKQHLKYLEDPWKIAQHVKQTLDKDRFDEALLLIQRACRNRQLVVSWNYLIDYQLKKQRLHVALKIFQDMKKRAQLPNLQTFTIIFRGCANSQDPKTAVTKAVNLYHALLRDERLKPNSIHLNALMNVCARAGDLDSMFLIADTANDSTRAPTAYTYAIILNALRHYALLESNSQPPDQRGSILQSAIDRAKSLWVKVMDGWIRGKLSIDEELVCAMGRVLLLAPRRQEKCEVLELLQQTMDIPNLIKPLAHQGILPGSTKCESAVSPGTPCPSSSGPDFALPGRNTLALVITTLTSSKLTTTGIKYWNLLVRKFEIIPDKDIWLRMFGMLKVAKASGHAAQTLDMVPDELIDGQLYRIAMESCVRDNINPNAIRNSLAILNSMIKRLPVPDLQTLRLFLRVALVSHFRFRAEAKAGDEIAARREYGLQIMTALFRLWEPYKRIHNNCFKAAPLRADIKGNGVHYNDRLEIISLARLMFGAFTKVINERMLPDEDLRSLRSMGSKINRDIQAFCASGEETEPSLGHSGLESNLTNARTSTVPSGRPIYKPPGGDFVWNTSGRGISFTGHP